MSHRPSSAGIGRRAGSRDVFGERNPPGRRGVIARAMDKPLLGRRAQGCVCKGGQVPDCRRVLKICLADVAERGCGIRRVSRQSGAPRTAKRPALDCREIRALGSLARPDCLETWSRGNTGQKVFLVAGKLEWRLGVIRLIAFINPISCIINSVSRLVSGARAISL